MASYRHPPILIVDQQLRLLVYGKSHRRAIQVLEAAAVLDNVTIAP
jgi:hypothetical protein